MPYLSRTTALLISGLYGSSDMFAERMSDDPFV